MHLVRSNAQINNLQQTVVAKDDNNNKRNFLPQKPVQEISFGTNKSLVHKVFRINERFGKV